MNAPATAIVLTMKLAIADVPVVPVAAVVVPVTTTAVVVPVTTTTRDADD